MSSNSRANSNSTYTGWCAWLFLLFILLPFIQYIAGFVLLLIAFASLPYCFRLARVVEICNVLRPSLVGSVFSSVDFFGIIRSVNPGSLLTWPSLVIDADVYLHNDTMGKKSVRSLVVRSLSVFASNPKSRWPEVALHTSSAVFHGDLSPEAKSIELFLKLLADRDEIQAKVVQLNQRIVDLDRSIKICVGNPLLEPSLDNLQEAAHNAKRIKTKLSSGIAKLELKASSLRDFLSLPQGVRDSLSSGFDEDLEIGIESNDADYDEVVDLMRALDELNGHNS